jgi:hypothetical protein
MLGFKNMKEAFTRWMKVAIVALAVIILGIFGTFFLWRYTPVRLRVEKVEKIVVPDAMESDRKACAHFDMSPQQFADHFATLKRILPVEFEQYGFGSCYFKTTIEGRTYIIWEGYAAEIEDGDDTTYYASDKYLRVPPEEASGWLWPWLIFM